MSSYDYVVDESGAGCIGSRAVTVNFGIKTLTVHIFCRLKQCQESELQNASHIYTDHSESLTWPRFFTFMSSPKVQVNLFLSVSCDGRYFLTLAMIAGSSRPLPEKHNVS